MTKNAAAALAAIIRGIRLSDSKMAENIAMQLASVRISPTDPDGPEFTDQLNALIDVARSR